MLARSEYLTKQAEVNTSLIRDGILVPAGTLYTKSGQTLGTYGPAIPHGILYYSITHEVYFSIERIDLWPKILWLRERTPPDGELEIALSKLRLFAQQDLEIVHNSAQGLGVHKPERVRNP